VFFSGCNLGCVFCQNREISRRIAGKQLDARALREVFVRLRDSGVHNLNLVTATPYADAVAEALEEPLGIPVVWNTGGYESVETLKLLEGKVDIWLPDMKYADAALARRLSGAADYFSTAQAAIAEMYRQVGDCEFDEDGILRRGVIIRHLVIPGEIGNSKDVLDWFDLHYRQKGVLFSLMAQYTPNGFGGPDRRLTQEEYQEVADYLYMLDIENGFLQELSSAKEEYTPPFDGTGLE